MLVHKVDNPNGNGLDFPKAETEENMATLLNKPIVCKYHEDKDDLGTHEPVFDAETGAVLELNTIAVGSITDVWIDKVNDESDFEALYAKATLWSYKYPAISKVIAEHHNNQTSNTSVEVEIYEYGATMTDVYRPAKRFTYLAHCILGSTIKGADDNSAVIGFAEKQIAQAVLNDKVINQELKGDETTLADDFNKGIQIRYHGNIETNSLKLHDIESRIYNHLNPLNPKDGTRKYNFFIRDIYNDHAIAEDWADYEILYKIDYEVSGEDIIIAPKDKWEKGSLGFVPSTVEVASLIKEVTELNTQLNSLKEEVEEMSKTNKNENELTKEQFDTELAAKELEINTLTEKVDELNSLIVGHETEKATLTAQVNELKPFKEKVELAEKEAKVQELNAKYSPLLGEDALKTEEVAKLISEGNEVELNNLVVKQVIENQGKQKAETELNSQGEVIIPAAKATDLTESSYKEKYGFSV